MLSICIYVAKYKFRKSGQEIVPMNNSNQVDYGKLINSGIFVALLCISLCVIIRMKDTPPNELITFNDGHFVYLLYSGLPAFVGVVTVFLFFAKSKALRKHLKLIVCKGSNVYPINE